MRCNWHLHTEQSAKWRAKSASSAGTLCPQKWHRVTSPRSRVVSCSSLDASPRLSRFPTSKFETAGTLKRISQYAPRERRHMPPCVTFMEPIGVAGLVFVSLIALETTLG